MHRPEVPPPHPAGRGASTEGVDDVARRRRAALSSSAGAEPGCRQRRRGWPPPIRPHEHLPPLGRDEKLDQRPVETSRWSAASLDPALPGRSSVRSASPVSSGRRGSGRAEATLVGGAGVLLPQWASTNVASMSMKISVGPRGGHALAVTSPSPPAPPVCVHLRSALLVWSCRASNTGVSLPGGPLRRWPARSAGSY